MSAEFLKRADSPSAAFFRGVVSGFASPLAIFPTVKAPQGANSDVEKSFRLVGRTLNKNFKIAIESRNGGRSK